MSHELVVSQDLNNQIAARMNQQIRDASRDQAGASHAPRNDRVLRSLSVVGTGLMAIGLAWFGANLLWFGEVTREEPIGAALIDAEQGIGGSTIAAVVERIIVAESDGDPNLKNKRSSATGLGQFLNQTWLDLIRAHRPDLARGRDDSEILELRRDPKVASEITTRFTERNAAMMRRRGLPVTPGTLYLAHFAGGAGAVAILLALDNADAASVIANADVTGRTKRESIVKANPFLERFTVADIKSWADRKMRIRRFHSPSLGSPKSLAPTPL